MNHTAITEVLNLYSVGEAKPSVDGEEERISVRHGDNEFIAGIELLIIIFIVIME